ncbi:hypothetical protein DIPPA_56643 [Diplonema papillatum]|nr:hypothetical protein DIPPA_56643 [Diplonema papillatum]
MDYTDANPFLLREVELPMRDQPVPIVPEKTAEELLDEYCSTIEQQKQLIASLYAEVRQKDDEWREEVLRKTEEIDRLTEKVADEQFCKSMRDDSCSKSCSCCCIRSGSGCAVLHDDRRQYRRSPDHMRPNCAKRPAPVSMQFSTHDSELLRHFKRLRISTSAVST